MSYTKLLIALLLLISVLLVATAILFPEEIQNLYDQIRGIYDQKEFDYDPNASSDVEEIKDYLNQFTEEREKRKEK